ncbi:unnamed protein product [Allacma fusca]|uniref:Uncharacterized protein n=1 Tax=Allacma fusca TaxID=39272 RepID=A0A8J2P5N6_9HEXA|nr:unnamed protein product [Allacma fusca]
MQRPSIHLIDTIQFTFCFRMKRMIQPAKLFTVQTLVKVHASLRILVRNLRIWQLDRLIIESALIFRTSCSWNTSLHWE